MVGTNGARPVGLRSLGPVQEFSLAGPAAAGAVMRVSLLAKCRPHVCASTLSPGGIVSLCLQCGGDHVESGQTRSAI